MNVLAPALVALAYLVSGTDPYTKLESSQRIAGGEKGILVMAGTTFPNATTTGVPAGTTLTAYTGPMTITRDGTVIDGKIINGTLRIEADNVVIKNSKITFNGSWGIDAEGAANVTIQDNDIIGPGYSGTSNSAILGSGNFLRNDISKVENGITLQGGASVVKGNYIHNLENSGADPHYDGIQVYGGQNGVLIEDNTVLARDTSSIFIANLYGAVNNVKVNHNYLAGADIALRVEGTKSSNPITGVSITNNYVEKGYWGYYVIEKASPAMSGNIEFLPGTYTPDLAPSVPAPSKPAPSEPAPSEPAPSEPAPSEPAPSDRTFMGTSGNDALPGGRANSGNEKFYGLAGNDVLRGGAGADHLDGGGGVDTASYAGSNAAVNVRLDTGKASGGHATGDKLVSIENLTGSSHNDTLRGNSGDNVLDGGSGADYMAGGAGNDTYVVDNAKDVVFESGTGGGRDTVKSSVSYTIASNVEELHLTGTANLNGTGNTGSNVLRGNSGNNVLNGHNGNDVINGGLGNDTLKGGYQKDTFVFDTALNASNNVDRITDFSVVDDVIHLDNAVFTALTKTGTLADSAFVKNTTGFAQDSNDRIIYEADTGELYYDANGSASGGSVHFATLNPNLALTAADFLVI